MFHPKSSSYRPPFRITELLQLTHLGISLEHITWSRVTMTSNQWICVRHRSHCKNADHNCCTAVTVLNPWNSHPQTFQADTSCAKMNPEKPLIALRADSRFQVFDLESKKCRYWCRLDFNIQFWTWINSTTIALVSDSAVYHWHLLDKSVWPERIFRRDSRMENVQIVQYAASDDLRWFALTGLFSEETRIVGLTQVYSSDRNLCQTFEAHCAHFTSYQFKENLHPSCVLIVASRGYNIHGKLHVVELGPLIKGNTTSTCHTGMLEFSDEWYRYDFPSSIQVSSKLGLVYVVTKYGRLYVCDLESCSVLCSMNICTDVIFTTAFNHETEGIIAVARNGQVLSIDVKMDHLVRYIWEVSKRTHIAERLLQILQNDNKDTSDKDVLTTKL